MEHDSINNEHEPRNVTAVQRVFQLSKELKAMLSDTKFGDISKFLYGAEFAIAAKEYGYDVKTLRRYCNDYKKKRGRFRRVFR